MDDIPSGLLEEMLRSAQGASQQLPDVGHLMSGLTVEDMNARTDAPLLRIIEQPKSRGFRFRYPCEGPSHGGLPGTSSTKTRKSYPTVKLFHYTGKARLMLSLVTNDNPPRPHAHSLVGKNAQSGQCTVEFDPDQNMCASFPNLGILHETKRNVPKALLLRYAWEKYHDIRLLSGGNDMSATMEDNVEVGVDQRDLPPLSESMLIDLRKKADEDAKNMNLSVVRLCFQAFLPDEHGHFVNPLSPCISDPVYDSKAPSASTLKICRMDRHSGSVAGGDEIFLLCDRVQKDDIEVKFIEKEPVAGGNWEALASFSTNDVHRQYAIVFKTPRYWNQNISQSVQVYIQLKRKSDGELSEPKVFTYQPLEYDIEQIGRKRRKKIPNFQESMFPRYAQNAGVSLPPSTSSFLGSLPFNFQPLQPSQQVQQQPQPPLVSSQLNGSQSQKSKGQKQNEEAMDVASLASSRQIRQMLTPQAMDAGDQMDPSDRSFDSITQQALEELSTVVTQAIRNYAATNDVKYLLAPHRLFAVSQDEYGDTPLHMAVIHCRHRAVENFLSVLEGIPAQALDVQNKLRQTPLHLAVLTNQPNIVEKLVLSGASTSVPDRSGNTPAHIACKKGETKCLEALLRRPDPMQGQNKYADLTQTNNDGFAPLHLAAKAKSLDCLRLLHMCRTDMNITDAKSGRTALHFSVESNDLAIAGSLVTEFGADVDYPDFNCDTPLHLAAGRNDKSFVAFLLAAGADPIAPTASEKTPSQLTTSPEIKTLFEEIEKAKGEGRRISLTHVFQTPKSSTTVPNTGALPQSLMSGGILTSGGHGGPPPGQMSFGGLKQLGYVERLRLALILDQQRTDEKDWRGLAKHLGVPQLITALGVQKSPTRMLLQHYESANGTVEGLLSALVDLGRADAASSLQEAISMGSGAGGAAGPLPVGLGLATTASSSQIQT
eukprot:m.177408 g.177408  ORF g.177408 m.177408 type:complete len:939 (+) comp39158_c2_seq68:4396-7212(+)